MSVDDLYDQLTYLTLLKYGSISEDNILDKIIIAYLLAKNSKPGISNQEIMKLSSDEFESITVFSFRNREYYIKRELSNIDQKTENLLLKIFK